jgi:outer membrane immunogenic protein
LSIMKVSRVFPVFAALVAWPAAAADVIPGAPAPPPLQCIWCGWYAGANVGGTWGGDPVTINTVPAGINSIAPPVVFSALSVPAASSASGTFGPDKGGFIGGGQAGYNWQFGSWVAGMETDFQGVTGGKSFAGTGAANSPLAAAGTDNTTFTASKMLNYLGTVRARSGYAVVPTLLAYATGGLAYGGASGTAGFTTTNAAFPPHGLSPAWGTAGSYSSILAGWTLGAGLEWMFAAGWSAKVEYLYYDLGTVSYGIGTSGTVVLPGFVPAGTNWFTNVSTASTRYNGSIARIGLNYQFNLLP